MPVLASLTCKDILARCQRLSRLSHGPSYIVIFQMSLKDGAPTSDWDSKQSWNSVDKFSLQRAFFLQVTCIQDFLFGGFERRGRRKELKEIKGEEGIKS